MNSYNSRPIRPQPYLLCLLTCLFPLLRCWAEGLEETKSSNIPIVTGFSASIVDPNKTSSETVFANDDPQLSEPAYLSAAFFQTVKLAWVSENTSTCTLFHVDGRKRTALSSSGTSGNYLLSVLSDGSFQGGGHTRPGKMFEIECCAGTSSCDRRILGISGSACEVDFSYLTKRLMSGAVVGVPENSFRSWASNDSFDYCQFASGRCTRGTEVRSGDMNDLQTFILERQSLCEALLGQLADAPYDRNSLFELQSYTAVGKPVLIAVAFPAEGTGSDTLWSGHALIALSVKIASEGAIIEVLDSNGPAIRNLSCKYASVPNWPSEDGNLTQHGFVCGLYDSNAVLVHRYFPDPGFTQAQTLWATRTSYCNTPAAATTPFCAATPAQRLRNDFPNIDNPGDGSCAGWADFVLHTAYLGNFTGECPHR